MAMTGNFLKNILGEDGVGDGGCYFGDNTAPADADIVVVSAPWSVTADFGRGATYTPDAIIDVSLGKELYDAPADISIEGRIATAEIDYNIQERSEQLGRDAERIMRSHRSEAVVGEYVSRKVSSVNEGFAEMHQSIYNQVKYWSMKGKRVAVIGGDHSVAFGAVKAFAEREDQLGVLFIDAHADFSRDDEVFKFSHRTIARDIVDAIPSVAKLVQVGVRDVDKAEVEAIRSNDRVEVFFAEELMTRRFEGSSWGVICREVVERLPQKVYVSLDIDALKIEFCNNTNAPTPGGMTFDEVVYMVNCVVASGREIVGFDISEVVTSLDDKMDAIVAARLLAKLSVAMLRKK